MHTHVIINIYFFFLFSLTSHFTFLIYNFECIMTSTLFITFASSFLIFCDILFIFILCIIILNLLRRKVVVVTIFSIQKLFDFNIFLFFLKIILNIINSLNFCIFIIYLRAVSVIATLNSRINIIIFFAFIFYICFIFWIIFIYVINFIFLLSFRFDNALITRAISVKNVISRFSAATFA